MSFVTFLPFFFSWKLDIYDLPTSCSQCDFLQSELTLSTDGSDEKQIELPNMGGLAVFFAEND